METGYHERFIPPSQEEMERMIKVAPEHIRRVIILGSRCGIRIGKSELFSLTWDDVNLEKGLIRIRGSAKNPNAQWREVPLQSFLVKWLCEWRLQDMSAGINNIINYNGKTVSSIRSSWQSTLRKAGIKRHIRPYELQHAFATELLSRGVDVGTVAKLMGHSSPMMVFKHYQYVIDQQKKAAINSLPQFDIELKYNAENVPK